MAMKIRCTDCTKKISIDEAFGGGMCRCPYCSAIVPVPAGGKSSSAGGRPEAPGARPEAPGELQPAGVGAPQPTEGDEAEEYIPTASPVRLQGIVTIILLALLVVMVAGVVVLAIHLGGGDGEDGEPPPPPVNPFIVSESGPAVAGIILDSPVVYCIDAGSSIAEVLDFAVAITRVSIKSLPAGHEFNVIVCQETTDRALSAAFQAGGDQGAAASRHFLTGLQEAGGAGVGATNIPRALFSILNTKPKTIVLFARKPVNDTVGAMNRARREGVEIITIALDCDKETQKSMATLAKATRSQSRVYTWSNLQNFLSKAPPID